MQIIDTDLGVESEKRYLTYALSVVSGRAIPDIRDGLKPVQRRILYAMFSDLKLLPTGTFRKSAAVVGEVLAKYHPHGDLACYEAMVRLAQDFSMRFPLIEGQGNFGSLDGDNAAAYRYTEVKLREIAVDVIGEIKEDTVAYRPNFDTTAEEPVVFPARYPNLLTNGSSGIAVGIATNIPPHNLANVCKATIALANSPGISIRELLRHLVAPDFPTYCSVHNSEEELIEIYESGRGSIRMRANYEVVSGRNNDQIVFNSIPYGIDKSSLLEKIASLINDRKIPQINDLRDESTEQVRIVIDLVKETEPEIVCNFLFKNTPLESNFNVNLTVLVPAELSEVPTEELAEPKIIRYDDSNLIPRKVSLKDILAHFLSFRYRIVADRLQYEATKLRSRLHLLDGILKICLDLDKAIAIVRESDGRSDSARKLQSYFSLSEEQSYHVVDMRIYQLSKILVAEVEDEANRVRIRLNEIEDTITNGDKIRTIVIEELKTIQKKYQQPRRSDLFDYEEIVIREKDFVVEEEVYVLLSKDGWIKRIKRTRQSNPSQTRMRDGDELKDVLEVGTTDNLYFFSNLGYVYVATVDSIPSGSGFGTPVSALFKFQDLESVIGVSKVDEGEVFMVAGDLVHRTQITKFPPRKTGRRLMKVDEEKCSAVYFGKPLEYLGFVAFKANHAIAAKISLDQIPLRQVAAGVKLANLEPGSKITAISCSDFKCGETEIILDKLPLINRGRRVPNFKV